MAWDDGSETFIAGGGEVYVAAVGTALPTATTSALPVANWNGLGFHTEDGVAVTPGLEINEFRVWQKKLPVRREVGERSFEISFTLVQWNEVTLPFAMGGGTITDLGSGQYKFTPPASTDALQERAMVVDVDDGTRRGRFVVPRGNVSEGQESQFQSDEMAGLAVTFQALEPTDGSAPWNFFSNDPAAFAAGS